MQQNMLSQRMSSGLSSRTSVARCLLALVLVACLADSISGSCLSYGHSCWGAHGKRSGRAPSSAPDWYITRMLRRMAAIDVVNRARHSNEENNDIYRGAASPQIQSTLESDRGDVPEVFQNDPDARPMLNENEISKLKLWQIMQAATENE